MSSDKNRDRKNRFINGVMQSDLVPQYDPIEDLTPENLEKVMAAPSHSRDRAIDAAFDEQGYMSKLKRFMKGAYYGNK